MNITYQEISTKNIEAISQFGRSEDEINLEKVPNTNGGYQPCIRMEETMSVLSPHCQQVLKEMPLGSSVRCCFNLESGTTFLNHGSYGTAPTPVLSSQAYFVNRMEMNPDRFLRRELPDFKNRSLCELSQFVHADVSDIVFVPNTTTGVNSVLRSMDLQEGDEVLCLNITYRAVLNTLRHICYYTQEMIDLKVVDVQLPLASYQCLIDQIDSALSEKTRLAVFDHISSSSGLLLPVESLIQTCHTRGIPVLIDGAHVPGHIPLNLRSLGADFYVANLYKWGFSSKSCAFLYVKQDYQSTIRPVVTALGYEQGYLEEFSHQGTRDDSSYLTLPTAFDFYRSIGYDRVYAHNSGLINWASEYLSKTWHTDVLLPLWQRAPFMSAVRLPILLPKGDGNQVLSIESQYLVCDRIQEFLLDTYQVAVHIVPIQDCIHARLSAQVYNQRSDFERLGAVVKHIISTNESGIVEQLRKLNLQ